MASLSGPRIRSLRSPQQEIESVLAEEGLAIEHKGWHAPLPGGLERFMIALKRVNEVLRGLLDLLVERLEVEARASCCAGEHAPPIHFSRRAARRAPAARG
jgi:hypothetical protein